MTVDDAIAIVNQALGTEPLTDIQELVFRAAWHQETYQHLAATSNHGETYWRGVGAQLWQHLREKLEINITKTNLRVVIPQYARRSPASGCRHRSQQSTCIPPDISIPDGPVELQSPLYIERPPIEGDCYAEILQPGALIRLRAPRQMGKTSLKNRILQYAQTHRYRTVRLDFSQTDLAQLANINRLLRWFCANIALQLEINAPLDEYWDEDIGAIVSCTLYMQQQILSALSTPLVLALDEVNRLFEFPEIARSFLPLLRSWYEEGKDLPIWQNLRLIVAHSTEIYVPLNVHQSPFNVGLAFNLPEFTPEQVDHLAQLHQLPWSVGRDSQALIQCVGGHPYRIRLALYHLKHSDLTLTSLIQSAADRSGIYQGYLRSQLALLKAHPDLYAVLHDLVNIGQVTRADPIALYKLESMGVVHTEGDTATLSCDLFYRYFQTYLTS